MLTKEEPTRLQHIVTTNESLIKVPPRVRAGECIPLCKRARPQGTLPPQKRLICEEAVSIDAHLFYLIGIEMRRAQRLGFGGSSTRFQVGLSPTPITHVSSSLPMIPDGRISRVRFEATTAPLCAFLSLDRLKPVVGIHPWSESLRTA
jgi:hypothetical protein